MSTSERVQMWAMRGLTAAEITHQTKLPRSTVKYHLKRFKETGSWSRREYPVRVKTLTPFADCIKKHLKLHPHASATELHELLATKYQLVVSVRTVQRYLKTAIREQKSREEISGEDSDTSTTEEVSVTSVTDQGVGQKAKNEERRKATTQPGAGGQKPKKTDAVTSGSSGARIVGQATTSPCATAAPSSSTQMHPSLLPVPCNVVQGYPMVVPSWQDSQSATRFSGFPLPAGLQTIPLGLYPINPPFNAPIASDAPAYTYAPGLQPIAPPATSPHQSPLASAHNASLEPSLQALINAALVSE